MEQLTLFEGETVTTRIEVISVDEIAMPAAELVPENPAFTENVRKFGIINLPLVRQVGSGYEALAGKRRIRAMIDRGETKVECRVIPKEVGLEAAAVIRLSENQHRSPNYLEEMADYQALMGKNRTAKDVAEIVGVSVTTVRQRLALDNLISPWRELLGVGAIPYSKVIRILKLSVQKQEALHEQFLINGGKLTGAEIKKQERDVREVHLEDAGDLVFDLPVGLRSEVEAAISGLLKLDRDDVPAEVRERVDQAVVLLTEGLGYVDTD